MRIGHCQFESKPGDFEGNLARVVAGLERADRERLQIVCFPECFLTGYPDTEAAAREVAIAADSPVVPYSDCTSDPVPRRTPPSVELCPSIGRV